MVGNTSLQVFNHNDAESQRFGSSSIPSNTQSLLIFVLSQVTEAERPNIDEKRLPCTGSFNFGNKSMVDLYQVDLYLHLARSNISQPYQSSCTVTAWAIWCRAFS
ncbi:hypothetical protein TNIN_343981 [Trichonephila inaurata madagascariensis]|uniref:Uncharacterized protein n=1 Tax=Trichonephila inaurata madagascariensis TaxID=2747483 RepID=A0A8X7BRA1_9ARAC|nr:hypothetical protein TNIN_343981 [Trichonephila inaurata madagascariensis]